MRTTLLALLCLLGLATSASAECAWVLWEWDSTIPGWNAPQWIRSAHPTYADCKKAADEMNTAWKNALSTKELTPDIVRCLPDSIDPRGPKGK